MEKRIDIFYNTKDSELWKCITNIYTDNIEGRTEISGEARFMEFFQQLTYRRNRPYIFQWVYYA